MKAVELTFHPLDTKYLDEVLAIEKNSFPVPWTRGMFEREISLIISRFYVALIDEHVVGYGGYWCVSDEAHIVNLAVHPDFRSKGIGRGILQFIVENISGKKITRSILLEVRKGNIAAQKLYESAGFIVTGVRPRYYGTEDAVLMEKKI